MVIKTLIELGNAFVFHLLVFNWMHRLPPWVEALLFISAVLALVVRFRRSPLCEDSSPGLTLALQMQIGRLRLALAFGRNMHQPVDRLKGE
jgi:hypothetical protein